MYLGYQGELIAMAAESKEELEKIPFIKFDRIEETSENYELFNGRYYPVNKELVAVKNELFSYPSAEHKSGKLSIPVSQWIDGSADTIHIRVETLKELNKQAEQKGLSGIWLECSSDRYWFMLTSFHYSYYGDEANLILNGYLFMK